MNRWRWRQRRRDGGATVMELVQVCAGGGGSALVLGVCGEGIAGTQQTDGFGDAINAPTRPQVAPQYSLTDLLTHSHLLTHSLTHAFIQPLTHPFTDSLARSLAHIYSLIRLNPLGHAHFH